MRHSLVAVLWVGLAGGLLAQAPVDDFLWSPRVTDVLDPSIGLTFSLEMAGADGTADFRYDKGAAVQILGVSLLLSQNESALFSEQLDLVLVEKTAANAEIRTIEVDRGRTVVEFSSSLRFIAKAAGLVSVTYSVAGETKTVFNDRLIEARLVGTWKLQYGDSYPVGFRRDRTVLWGNGAPAVPWKVADGRLSFGAEPAFQENVVTIDGQRLTLRGPDTIFFVRDFGTDHGSVQEPEVPSPKTNRLMAAEDYEFEEVGQRVNSGSGDEVLRGFSDPKATKQTIVGTRNGLRFIVVSSDPATAIVFFKGGKEVSRQSSASGFLLGALLEDETDSLELHGVGFNTENKHFNTWCEMYMTSSVEDASAQAKSILATWQARENKPWVVFVESDGRFDDLVR